MEVDDRFSAPTTHAAAADSSASDSGADSSAAAAAGPSASSASALGKRKRDEQPDEDDYERAVNDGGAAGEAAPVQIAAVAAAAAANPSPLLRCLDKCRDVQFTLMQMMTLKDLAALNSTCHRWRQWLLRPPLISGLRFICSGSFLRLLAPAMSGWARRIVTAVCLQLEGGDDDSTLRLLPGPVTVAAESAACDRLLCTLPRFTRLRALIVELCDAFATTSLWPTCFTALSSSLSELRLLGYGDRQAALVNAALAHVGRLRCLTALAIVVDDDRAAREVDLSELPSLACLHKLTVGVLNEQDESFWFRCTPAQIHSLAQCRQLTHLFGGIWSPDERELDDDGWQLPPPAQQIDEGIATLVRGLTLQTADAAAGAGASASSVAPVTSTASFCRLQFLGLQGTFMSAAVWEHVSQLTELRQLVPESWRSDITPQLWARLADFQQLQIIHIELHPDDDYSLAPLRTEHFLQPLLQCVQLERVSFAGSPLALSDAQLDGIPRLPLLHTLHMQLVEVESIAPLVHAATLECLWLSFCRGPPGVVDFRRSLPPLPALTELRLEDRCRITATQAAPFNAALLAHMPKLIPAEFTQNLLA